MNRKPLHIKPSRKKPTEYCCGKRVKVGDRGRKKPNITRRIKKR